MDKTRRGFLGLLGRGSVAGAVLGAGGYAVGIDKGVGKDKTMFNFTCTCGKGIVAEVPKNIGAFFRSECECGTVWELEWMGDSFRTRSGSMEQMKDTELGKRFGRTEE